jgi:hypothetical protein
VSRSALGCLRPPQGPARAYSPARAGGLFPNMKAARPPLLFLRKIIRGFCKGRHVLAASVRV